MRDADLKLRKAAKHSAERQSTRFLLARMQSRLNLSERKHQQASNARDTLQREVDSLTEQLANQWDEHQSKLRGEQKAVHSLQERFEASKSQTLFVVQERDQEIH